MPPAALSLFRGQELTSGSQQTLSSYKWWQIFLPDRGGWFFAYLMFLMLFVRPELLLWDGGTCRHVINGVLMLDQHHIPTANFTSWPNDGVVVITRSWLADLISGVFYKLAALNGVVFICGLVISLGLTWSYQMGRSRGFGLASGLVMLALVMATVGMHWSARSHVYSYLPFLVMYYLLFMTETAPLRRVVAVTVTLCLWANLHGSFSIGVGMILLKLVADVLQVWQSKTDSGKVAGQLKWDATSMVCALAATAINPRGLDFYTHVASYLSNPTVHRTDEWKPFDIFAGMGAPAFIVLSIVIGLMVWKTKKFASRTELVLLIVLGLAGLNSMRLIPYCALLAMPVAGPAWQAIRRGVSQDVAAGVEPSTWHQKWLRKVVTMEDRADSQEKSSVKMSLIVVALVLFMGVISMTVPLCAIKDFDPERIPVDALAFMTDKSLVAQRGFNYDNWGGYIFFKTKQRVYIDDWADFLSPAFIDEYVRILLVQPGWQKDFAQRQFQWVLTPPEANIAQVLRKSPDWQVAKEDKTAVLLVRKKQ